MESSCGGLRRGERDDRHRGNPILPIEQVTQEVDPVGQSRAGAAEVGLIGHVGPESGSLASGHLVTEGGIGELGPGSVDREAARTENNEVRSF